MKLDEIKARYDDPERRVVTDYLRGDFDAVIGDLESASPFTKLRVQADKWKSYLEASTLKAFPNVAGPAASGNYLGNHAQVIARNHTSLHHQWLNLEHSIAAYGSNRDRIIGAILSTHFPPAPGGAMKWEMPASVEAAPAVSVLAVMFKLAQGVSTVMGQHMTGRKTFSVSIEQITDFDNLGIYFPSTQETVMMMDADTETLSAIGESESGGILLGKHPGTGEQLAFAYGGMDGEVDFRGLAVVERGADKKAFIARIEASAGEGLSDLCSVNSSTAAAVLLLEQLPGMRVEVRGRDRRWRAGVIQRAAAESLRARGSQLCLNGSEENPAVEVRMDAGHSVFRTLLSDGLRIIT